MIVTVDGARVVGHAILEAVDQHGFEREAAFLDELLAGLGTEAT